MVVIGRSCGLSFIQSEKELNLRGKFEKIGETNWFILLENAMEWQHKYDVVDLIYQLFLIVFQMVGFLHIVGRWIAGTNQEFNSIVDWLNDCQFWTFYFLFGNETDKVVWRVDNWCMLFWDQLTWFYEIYWKIRNSHDLMNLLK